MVWINRVIIWNFYYYVNELSINCCIHYNRPWLIVKLADKRKRKIVVYKSKLCKGERIFFPFPSLLFPFPLLSSPPLFLASPLPSFLPSFTSYFPSSLPQFDLRAQNSIVFYERSTMVTLLIRSCTIVRDFRRLISVYDTQVKHHPSNKYDLEVVLNFWTKKTLNREP